MAVPTIEIDETNGAAPGAVTANIPYLAFASADLPSNTSNLVATDPILVGTLSFEKWFRAKLTTAAPTGINGLTVSWYTQAPTDANGNTGFIDCKFGVNAAYVAPVSTASAVAVTECLNAANVAVTPPGNVVGEFSGYIVAQLSLLANCAAGDLSFPADVVTFDITYS